MDSYKIEWKRSASKELRKLDKSAIPRILEAVEYLVYNPHPLGSKKILGAENIYRIRIGDYRVIYSIESGKLIIEIVRVGHRKEVYEKNKR